VAAKPPPTRLVYGHIDGRRLTAHSVGHDFLQRSRRERQTNVPKNIKTPSATTIRPGAGFSAISALASAHMPAATMLTSSLPSVRPRLASASANIPAVAVPIGPRTRVITPTVAPAFAMLQPSVRTNRVGNHAAPACSAKFLQAEADVMTHQRSGMRFVVLNHNGQRKRFPPPRADRRRAAPARGSSW